MNFWLFLSITILLTWIGARPVESQYINIGMILTVLYFLYFISDPILVKMWDKLTS